MSRRVLTETVLEQAREKWDRGEAPDAGVVITSHPECAGDKSLLLELAYEEYFRRIEAGEDVSVDAFCRRFPVCRMSLQRRIEVHQFLQDEPDWLSHVNWPQAGGDYLRFHLREELGRGAASRVFLAEERDLSNRLVVVKVSTHGYREAQILSRLEHPNIVPIYSVEQDDENDLVAICMPFLSSWTLLDLLDVAYGKGGAPGCLVNAIEQLRQAKPRGDTDWEDVTIDPFLRRASFVDGLLHLMVQLTEALEHTHRHGVLHLDLKPTNILLTASGRPLLLDFNLAIEDPTPDIVLGGTLPYMSPEQIRSTVLEESESVEPVDRRSDVYSLGVVFCELLSGAHPFGPVSRGELPSQLARPLLARQRDMGRRTLGKVSGIDPGLVHTVQRCLETDPQRRPQTAEELRRDLVACLSSFRRAARWCRSHPRIVALLAVVALALLACAAILVISRKPYGERQFLRGLACYEAEDFPEASRYFNLAVDAAPENAAWWYALARTRQRNGNYAEAIKDYWKAHRLSNDSRCLAAIAYCRTRNTDWTSAIKAYEDTVAAGRRDALLYAGLGYCQFELNECSEAKQSLSTALMQDPDLAVAYYFRAVNESRQSSSEQRPIEPRAVSDITEAMARGATGTRVFHSAALIFDRYLRNGPPDVWRSKILEILTKAVSEGMNRRSFMTLLETLGLSEDDRATALLKRVQDGQRDSRNPAELLDPLPDLPQLLLTP